jgi:hypothetical protein
LGNLYAADKRYAEAETLLKCLIAIMEKKSDFDRTSLATPLALLANPLWGARTVILSATWMITSMASEIEHNPTQSRQARRPQPLKCTIRVREIMGAEADVFQWPG